jgi:hypothetical protein
VTFPKNFRELNNPLVHQAPLSPGWHRPRSASGCPLTQGEDRVGQATFGLRRWHLWSLTGLPRFAQDAPISFRHSNRSYNYNPQKMAWKLLRLQSGVTAWAYVIAHRSNLLVLSPFGSFVVSGLWGRFGD